MIVSLPKMSFLYQCNWRTPKEKGKYIYSMQQWMILLPKFWKRFNCSISMYRNRLQIRMHSLFASELLKYIKEIKIRWKFNDFLNFKPYDSNILTLKWQQCDFIKNTCWSIFWWRGHLCNAFWIFSSKGMIFWKQQALWIFSYAALLRSNYEQKKQLFRHADSSDSLNIENNFGKKRLSVRHVVLRMNFCRSKELI